jgi:hypothetical protein
MVVFLFAISTYFNIMNLSKALNIVLTKNRGCFRTKPLFYYNMRITVKYLQEQLDNERLNSKRYYQLWQESKNELHNKNEQEMMM